VSAGLTLKTINQFNTQPRAKHEKAEQPTATERNNAAKTTTCAASGWQQM